MLKKSRNGNEDSERGRAVHSKRRELSVDYVLVARVCSLLTVTVVTISQKFQKPILRCL